MNWDWDKLQKQQQGRRGGGSSTPPGFEDFNQQFEKFKRIRFPGWKLVLLAVVILWLISGVYIVEPGEVGVVKRFGEYQTMTSPGPHYHIPYPVESAVTLNVERVRRMEFGFRSINRSRSVPFQQGQTRKVTDESLMLTGDENIVSVQFIVQYQIKNARNYLFNVFDQEGTIKNAAQAAMREVIGKSNIDRALTTGKQEIQVATRQLMQEILDLYSTGIRVENVQMQNVHPPDAVVDAFKDVASAREDKSRFINEAEAYRNDILPKARGQAARIINAAEAYREAKVRRSEGDASRFLSVLREYRKAKDVTRTRLYLETMEEVLAQPDADKVILSNEALKQSLPYLPLERVKPGGGKTTNKTQ
ncbi:FtsH protease activity modulator HflK [Desulfovibrio oxyclinae]|uniref:FtsH protease activity modulator HflK n=1 Tax=Desulfovibrio oxyclinae TaxID=63560 RepID=UPI00037EC1FA|nr:FtsH protease activity modulator HflK [Desulfovibrio oxyclinae]